MKKITLVLASFSMLLFSSCSDFTSQMEEAMEEMKKEVRVELKEELREEIEAELKADYTFKLSSAQEAFWGRLLKHCGKAYAGEFKSEQVPDDFAGKELKMYVMSCDEDTIKIPFYVGEDRSRTWVFTRTPNGILLKHDHRLEDGSDDEVTMYGGLTANGGSANVQYFPADEETNEMLPGAAANLWWVTVDNDTYSYNLRRVTGPNLFSVVFDLNNPIEAPELPWGHEL